MIKTTSYNQEEIISNIIKLYIPRGVIDCDCTYSKGVFYKHITPPELKFDLVPQAEGVQQGDCCHLPLEDASLDSIMFDPPFLASKGPSLTSTAANSKMAKRFGIYPDEKQLHQMYVDSLKEFHRVLKDKGVVIFKCQDKNSSGIQYMTHSFIIQQAIKLGFYPQDLFILLAKNRLVADWQLRNQKTARKFHSYFLVLRKCNRQVAYLEEEN